MTASALLTPSSPRWYLFYRWQSWFAIGMMLLLIAIQAKPEARAGEASGGDLGAGLFSEIKMSETLAVSANEKTTSQVQASVVLGVVSLAKSLSSAEIDNVVQSRSVIVPLANLLSDPSLSNAKDRSLTLTVDAEGERIDVFLPLDVARPGASPDGSKLYQAMLALSSESNVQLTVRNQSLHLHSSLSNRSVQADRVRAVAERLLSATTKLEPILRGALSDAATATAKATASGPVPSTPTAKPTESPSSSSQPTVAAQPVPSIVGTWSAKTSANDAWAIRFETDGRFVMVHTRNGKNSVSRGRFQVTIDRLVVSESAEMTLSGGFEKTSEQTFSWKLQDSTGKTLTTLAFTKQ